MLAITGFEQQQDWSIEIPTLFLRGEQSDYINAAGITEINQRFNNVNVETIAGAGHWLHAEQPQAFSSAVIDYLRHI